MWMRGGPPLAAETDGASLVSSVLLILEARRNLVRMVREGTLTRDQFAAGSNSRRIRRCSIDLVHLCTALWFHEREPLSRFVTMDNAQAEAADELGLPV